MCIYRATLFILLAVLVGCGNKDSSTIAEQFVASGHKSIDLASAVSTDWDRVCILGPYTTDASASQALGFKWSAEALTSIEENDGISLLVFVQNNKVFSYVEHSRSYGDFSNLAGLCFPRNKAKFLQSARPVKGWPGLFPANAS